MKKMTEVVEEVNKYESKPVQKLVASDRTSCNWAGTSVAMSADKRLLVVGISGYDEGGVNTGAVYIYKRNTGQDTYDPVHVQKLTASDCFAGDYFGSSVSLSADKTMLVVGSSGAGKRGHKTGAVYIYQRNDGLDTYSPIHTQKLMASDGTHWMYFGSSVSLSSDKDTLVVGTPGGYLGTENPGSVYIYKKNTGEDTYNPAHAQKLVANNRATWGRFGFSVSLSPDKSMLAVGATGGTDVGSVYIYKKNTGEDTYNPAYIQKLVSSDKVFGDNFGVSVSISPDKSMLAVGAALGADVGTVYIYKKNTGEDTYNPAHAQKLVSSESYTRYWFGASVHLADDGTLVVGAFGDDEDATDIGSVYIYQPLPIVEGN